MKPSERINELAQVSMDEAFPGQKFSVAITHYEKAIMQYLDEQAEADNGR